MKVRKVILVGGFLGAGKTTLLGQAAQRLASGGNRIGLVTNDQAANLVDTALLEDSGLGGVREVAGGCFCCRFPDLLSAIKSLIDQFDPDTLICEPVGSCTDISATVIQPLKKYHQAVFQLAPYAVLLDPNRTIETLGTEAAPTLPANVLYILRKQIEEADLLVINKIDMTDTDRIERVEKLLSEHCPETPVFKMSALTGQGIDQWLAYLQEHAGSGCRIAEVDYDEYAEGEACLGWLNARVSLSADAPADWLAFCDGLMRELRNRYQESSAEVAHLKLRLTVGERSLTANLTSTAGIPTVQGTVDITEPKGDLVFNARVRLEPDVLRTMFQSCLAAVAGEGVRAEVREVESFAPARPQPMHRFDEIVVLE
ncbi:MAG: GTP-binding protein [Planctomycetota bacterium]|jgi:G3E family GTPase